MSKNKIIDCFQEATVGHHSHSPYPPWRWLIWGTPQYCKKWMQCHLGRISAGSSHRAWREVVGLPIFWANVFPILCLNLLARLWRLWLVMTVDPWILPCIEGFWKLLVKARRLQVDELGSVKPPPHHWYLQETKSIAVTWRSRGTNTLEKFFLWKRK